MRRVALLATVLAALVGAAATYAPTAPHAGRERVIHITAKKFEYTPSEITVKKNVPVVLEVTSLDRHHGFRLREFGVRADVEAGATARVRVVPDKTGRFPFQCDVFCGGGHGDMRGELVVVE
jgi:cytochrome c oxidase subunit II